MIWSNIKKKKEFFSARFDFRSCQYTPTFSNELIGCAICVVIALLVSISPLLPLLLRHTVVCVSLLISCECARYCCTRCCYRAHNLQPHTNGGFFPSHFTYIFILLTSAVRLYKMPGFLCCWCVLNYTTLWNCGYFSVDFFLSHFCIKFFCSLSSSPVSLASSNTYICIWVMCECVRCVRVTCVCSYVYWQFCYFVFFFSQFRWWLFFAWISRIHNFSQDKWQQN